jgi:AhpD family alkylhydroperoxidase
MPRLTSLSVEQATGQAAQLYSAIQKQVGVVPNLYQAIGVNSHVLEAVLHLNAGLGSLSAPDKEAIALAVAESNSCDYCLAAHTYLGKAHGLEESEMLAIRKGGATDGKRNALIRFVREIVDRKGAVADETYQAFLAAGYEEQQVPAVVLAVVQNIYTNYFNTLNQTVVDFPAAPAL